MRHADLISYSKQLQIAGAAQRNDCDPISQGEGQALSGMSKDGNYNNIFLLNVEQNLLNSYRK